MKSIWNAIGRLNLIKPYSMHKIMYLLFKQMSKSTHNIT